MSDEKSTGAPISPASRIEKYRWKKGQSGNPVGRTGGFRHFTAKLYAQMLDSRVDEEGNPVPPDDPRFDTATPFPLAALNEYMRRILNPGKDTNILQSFVDRLLPHMKELDGILQHQRDRDLKFLTYMVFRYCFDEQQQVLLSKKRRIILICGRRAGKTVLIACLLILVAISWEKGDVLYLGRTAKSAYDIIWRTLVDVLEIIGIPYTPHLADQYIEFNTGVRIYVKGTASKEDIENLRGLGLRLAVKDECQSDSHSKLKMIVEEVLGPATRDYEGSQILLSGTPPRIEGSYLEEQYLENGPMTARFNWNMSVNPNIPNHETVLEEILANEFGGNANDTVWRREYKGEVGAYDTEALVLRFHDGNYFDEAQLPSWIDDQPITDLFFSGGIDYGFDDQDSCVIFLASVSKGERFLLYEYKGNRTGITDFADKVKRGIVLVAGNPIFAKLPDKRIRFFCDTEGLGKKITVEFAQQFGLTVEPAYQGQADMMLEMLQDDVKAGRVKVRRPQVIDGKKVVSVLEEEARKIVFARDEQDRLTRRVDDDVFHPELTKSVLYALRYVWLKSKVKLGGKAA